MKTSKTWSMLTKTRRRKGAVPLIAIGLSIAVALAVDFWRVRRSLYRLADAATLGSSMEATEAAIGKATGRGRWSGTRGRGTVLYYLRPYVWEHVPAAISKIELSPFRVSSSDKWYLERSPEAVFFFNEDGILVEVAVTDCCSSSYRVAKTSLTGR